MSTAKLARGEFRNPHPDPNTPAAGQAVEALLSTVQDAHRRFADPTADDYALARLSLDELQTRLLERTLTVPQLVEARIRLTVRASLATHCLTAFPYSAALEHAERYQQLLDASTPSALLEQYPLFGLVFSVKDCIHMQGLATTLGCSSRAAHVESHTAEIVHKLRMLGGIMIAKTTAPQLMMHNTTHSPLWGTTRSPISCSDGAEDEFQVGGSSGGEASLVKMGGSHLGVGTDMGGSVRQPACLAELVGFKFTATPDGFRWQLPDDFMTGLPHTTVPATAPGLLARDISTVRRAVDALEGSKASPDALPRIIHTAQYGSPEVSALITHLVSALGESGVQCDELGAVDAGEWEMAWAEHATQHGFAAARQMLANDPLIARTMFDESRLADSTWPPHPTRLAELKHSLQSRVGTNMLLTPTYVLGGPVRNAAFVQLDSQHAEVWCQIVNLLDWPAVSVPLHKLRPHTRTALIHRDEEWSNFSPGMLAPDPIEPGEGEARLPVLSIQLVAPPGHHQALLDLAQRVAQIEL
ncbi:acetamidase [Moesziomyces antarcticus]|uniref:Related to amidase n=2 Tax=Pseudozyma antarctica TaxID=84753 RepID=A0A5C3FWC8_PSEA2|nr:acetamidase [Moesziomyces antarcticus]GAK67411.1 acetamidase [Moesziomyces antarcticus]SPO48664.1 related to amidase [Moesziomyces antarcticus]